MRCTSKQSEQIQNESRKPVSMLYNRTKTSNSKCSTIAPIANMACVCEEVLDISSKTIEVLRVPS
jgi:hypothetical protein